MVELPPPHSRMTLDDSLMFHLTQGALRRWCLWNEEQLPSWAGGEEKKWALFQSWKKTPFKQVQDQYGNVQTKLHPMSEFDNWPYWLIVELIRYIQLPQEYNMIFLESESLKKAVIDCCDVQYSEHEQETPANLFA